MRRPARLAGIPGFGIDEVAEAAGDDPEVLRLENLDTDLPVPDGVVAATRRAVGVDEYNSYLPFDGRADLKAAIAAHFGRRSRTTVDPSQITITGGDGDGLNNALNATTDVGDEVIVTDPTYAGIVNRVRLVGARPQVVPLHVEAGAWRLDPDRLQSAITAKTRAVLLMNPAFPHGVRLNDDEWRAIASVCVEHDLWLIYWALYEGVVFDGAPVIHPVSLPGMAERTVTVAAVSMEWRMIGWRVGWTIGPPAARARPRPGARVQRGHARRDRHGRGRRRARDAAGRPRSRRGRASAPPRRDVGRALRASGHQARRRLVDADGLRAAPHRPEQLSRRLLREKVAATPMTGWGGPIADRHIRFVFSNEPVERLAGLRERVDRALEGG